MSETGPFVIDSYVGPTVSACLAGRRHEVADADTTRRLYTINNRESRRGSFRLPARSSWPTGTKQQSWTMSSLRWERLRGLGPVTKRCLRPRDLLRSDFHLKRLWAMDFHITLSISSPSRREELRL